MRLTNNTSDNYTIRQLKLPLEIEKLIDISDPVYTFCEVMDHIDLSGYFVEKGYKTGRPRCDEQKLLKVILFAFMEHGICSLRKIEKLCRNDIRYAIQIDVKSLKYSNSAVHPDRPYQQSVQTIREIVNSGVPKVDPRGSKGFWWDVDGSYNGIDGHYELLISPDKTTIWQYLFKGY